MFANASNYAVFGVVLGVIHSLVPMQLVNEIVLPSDVEKENILEYENAKQKFFKTKTYELTNPATSEEAR